MGDFPLDEARQLVDGQVAGRGVNIIFRVRVDFAVGFGAGGVVLLLPPPRGDKRRRRREAKGAVTRVVRRGFGGVAVVVGGGVLREEGAEGGGWHYGHGAGLGGWGGTARRLPKTMELVRCFDDSKDA